MGLWDKVKSVKNMVTGGAADVELEIQNEPQLGGTFTVVVRAQSNEDQLKAKSVYLKIRAQERIHVDGVEIEYEHGEREVERTVVNKSHITYRDEIVMKINEPLVQGETYEWEFEVSVPEELNGSYSGTYAWHEYTMLAGLDTAGNDPDTGWLDFEIY